MSRYEKRYYRSKFVEKGYEILTDFMFQVLKRVGVDLMISENPHEDTVSLIAYGNWNGGADDVLIDQRTYEFLKRMDCDGDKPVIIPERI